MTLEKNLTIYHCYKILDNRYFHSLATHSPHKIAIFSSFLTILLVTLCNFFLSYPKCSGSFSPFAHLAFLTAVSLLRSITSSSTSLPASPAFISELRCSSGSLQLYILCYVFISVESMPGQPTLQ